MPKQEKLASFKSLLKKPMARNLKELRGLLLAKSTAVPPLLQTNRKYEAPNIFLTSDFFFLSLLCKWQTSGKVLTAIAIKWAVTLHLSVFKAVLNFGLKRFLYKCFHPFSPSVYCYDLKRRNLGSKSHRKLELMCWLVLFVAQSYRIKCYFYTLCNWIY